MADDAKLSDLLERFESEAAILNKKSDSINRVLKAVEARLVKANAGVDAWVENPALYESTTRETDDRNVITVYCLGFDQVPSRGREYAWRLVVKQTEYNQVGPEESGPGVDVSISPLLEASRPFRVRALELLPALLVALSNAATAQVATIDEAAGKFPIED